MIRWSRLGIPLCWFDRHAPGRPKARWDGKTFSGTCRYCGQPILRRRPGEWRYVPGLSAILHKLIA